jgi:hypothetical protein
VSRRILAGADDVAEEAAKFIAADARAAVAVRGRFVVAVGGDPPGKPPAKLGPLVRRGKPARLPHVEAPA